MISLLVAEKHVLTFIIHVALDQEAQEEADEEAVGGPADQEDEGGQEDQGDQGDQVD